MGPGQGSAQLMSIGVGVGVAGSLEDSPLSDRSTWPSPDLSLSGSSRGMFVLLEL